MIILHFDLQPQFKYMINFIYTSHHFTPHGKYELNILTSLPMCGFIAQLVEHRTGIAEILDFTLLTDIRNSVIPAIKDSLSVTDEQKKKRF